MAQENVYLTPEEILELLSNQLLECNTLVSVLTQKTALDREELRKLRNNLMFARTKVRSLAQALDEMKKPINSFKLISS